MFLVEKYVHDEDYLNFIWDITNLYSKTKQDDNNGCNENELGPNMQTVQFATRFIMDIGSRTRTDSPMFDVWVNHIRRLYTNNLPVNAIKNNTTRKASLTTNHAL